jgi:dTDP-4-dehydrorhamnose 3,5-epimerase
VKAIETSLPGVVIVEADAYGDDRGWFSETWRAERYAPFGAGGPFLQDNFSSSKAGVLRGLHYQMNTPQGKLVWVTRGEVWDVAVDIRRGSPHFGKWFGTTLSATNHRQLWIPPGFAHGFLVTGDEADFCYKCTTAYSAGDDRAIRWDDPTLAIAWPLAGRVPVVSKKDAGAPLFADAEVFA